MSGANPKIVVYEDPDSASQQVAQIFANAIKVNPGIVLGLATGSTPVGTYRVLRQMHRDAKLDFSGITTFNLDEYIGLGPEHPQSFRAFMQDQLFDHVNVDPHRTHVPSGLTDDPAIEGESYEAAIASAGGIDLQLLGIGGNGHIAFNEPGSPATSRTRAVDLTTSTIDANSRFFDSIDAVPRQAITMGIGTIMEAKQIVLMACGEGKADAVALSIEGKLDESMPASRLQQHGDVTYVLDSKAASKLSEKSSNACRVVT
jgi:glucosamine-6-phosphate deaminase